MEFLGKKGLPREEKRKGGDLLVMCVLLQRGQMGTGERKGNKNGSLPEFLNPAKKKGD